jgi:hypothetical protein
MRKYYSIKSVKALQSCAFFVLSRKKERKKESESERWRVKEEGAETHTKKTLPLKFLFERNPKKKRSKTQESDVFSRQGPKKRPKKQSLGSNESEEARERRNAGHHTSHAQHTISSWHSDKP